MKQRRHLLHGVIEAAVCLRRALVLRQDAAHLVDHSDRDLGAANVNPADHFAFHISRLATRFLGGLKCFIKTYEY